MASGKKLLKKCESLQAQLSKETDPKKRGNILKELQRIRLKSIIALNTPKKKESIEQCVSGSGEWINYAAAELTAQSLIDENPE